MNIYFDNAATTALHPDVLDAMLPYFTKHWGNASATHQRGRAAREAIEQRRRTVADLLGASPDEIFFTSGATESNNLALVGSVRSGSIHDVITSPIEHKAVLQPLARLKNSGTVAKESVRLHWAALDTHGRVDYDHLEQLLDGRRNLGLSGRRTGGVLVSLMHGNNEVGNLTDIERVAWLCRQFGCYFHSDTVQTMGRYRYNLREMPVDFILGSAHKFHGPQGVGFLYVRSPHQLPALTHGGNQERGLRPGTENVAGIVGLAKALEISYRDRLTNQGHIQSLKDRLINRLRAVLPKIQFNGTSALPDESMATVLSISLPPLPTGESLVKTLDAVGIAVSGGSACSNLTGGGSHVLSAIGSIPGWESIRISFGKDNTHGEVDVFVETLTGLYSRQPVGETAETTIR